MTSGGSGRAHVFVRSFCFVVANYLVTRKSVTKRLSAQNHLSLSEAFAQSLVIEALRVLYEKVRLV